MISVNVRKILSRERLKSAGVEEGSNLHFNWGGRVGLFEKVASGQT